MEPRDFVHSNHPDMAGCPWTYLAGHCVLTKGHPTPHWLEVEQPMLPSAQGATDLLRKEKAKHDDDAG